jgi:tetratricopeptide (TPR) repeat protein
MNRRNRRTVARKGQTNSDLGGDTAAELFETAFSQMLAGQHLDAQLRCQQALEVDPNHADTLHLMSILSLHAQQYSLVLEWAARAIAQNPKPEYLSTLGIALWRLGRHDEALKVFDKAVQLRPEDAELWINLGKALLDLQRPADALLSFQHAAMLDPRHWDASQLCGVLLRNAGRFEEALVFFNRCEELRPNNFDTLNLRGATLQSLHRFEDYLANGMRLHELDPAQPAYCNNIGDALVSLDRREEALCWFDKALDLQPDYIGALRNKAVCFRYENRLEEAVEVYERLKLLDPDNARYDRHLAYTHLTMGNFDSGWSEREARFKVPGLSIHYPQFSQPRWLGKESIEGKTILVYADEGLGDSLQFARYLPLLAARGAYVILAVPDELHPLLSDVSGVAECQPYSQGIPSAFDMYCPMGSLSLAFGTRLDTIPAATYMRPVGMERVQTWEERLGPPLRLRAGIVWSGNPKHSNDRARSLPLQTMARLFDVDATFVSLQKDPRPGDKEFLSKRTDIVDLTSHLTDFVETAALISCLDVVITVDTSVAHLAATLGRPTWILLPYGPDWRWLLDRDDSPWYPTVRLFRQTETREYISVLDRVRTELQTLILLK